MPTGRRPPAGRRSRASPATPRPGGGATDRGAQGRPRSAPRERRSGSELLARILVAIPAAIVAILFIDLGGLPYALFMIAIGWVCLHELYRMLARWRPVGLVGFAALAGMVLAARYGNQRGVLEVAVGALPVLFVFVIARGQRGATVAIAGTLLGIYWIGFAFAHAELLRRLPHGNGVMLDVLVGTFVGDTAAYVGGRLFGRRPLAPQISPRKTVEGLFCGMLIAIVAVFVAGLYQTWLTQGDALLLGLAVAILAPLGDLFESVVKRDAGIKDAGHLFGAHGGALDRLDAVLFTVVAGYYIWVGAMH
jgi:phosphatidate cytidylyltransferase